MSAGCALRNGDYSRICIPVNILCGRIGHNPNRGCRFKGKVYAIAGLRCCIYFLIIWLEGWACRKEAGKENMRDWRGNTHFRQLWWLMWQLQAQTLPYSRPVMRCIFSHNMDWTSPGTFVSSHWALQAEEKGVFIAYIFSIRMYCIDRPRVPETNVLCIFHSLYD